MLRASLPLEDRVAARGGAVQRCQRVPEGIAAGWGSLEETTHLQVHSRGQQGALSDFNDSCAHLVFGLFFEAVDLHRCRDDGDLIRLKEVLYLAAKNSGFDWVWLALPPGRVCVCVWLWLWVTGMGLFATLPGAHQDAQLATGQRAALSSHPGQQSQLPEGYLASRTAHTSEVCVLSYTHPSSGAHTTFHFLFGVSILTIYYRRRRLFLEPLR